MREYDRLATYTATITPYEGEREARNLEVNGLVYKIEYSSEDLDTLTDQKLRVMSRVLAQIALEKGAVDPNKPFSINPIKSLEQLE